MYLLNGLENFAQKILNRFQRNKKYILLIIIFIIQPLETIKECPPSKEIIKME